MSQVEDQIIYSISYVGIDNPLPIELDISGLRGGANSTFLVSIVTNRNYSANNLYYSSIPLDFLRTKHKNLSFTLTCNSLPILCPDCVFYYDTVVTPVVTYLRYFDNCYL